MRRGWLWCWVETFQVPRPCRHPGCVARVGGCWYRVLDVTEDEVAITTSNILLWEVVAWVYRTRKFVVELLDTLFDGATIPEE